MLGLSVASERAWVEVARDALPALLVDHAHCELKAAQSALSLVAKYGHQAPAMVQPLQALASEELAHLRAVRQVLAQRGETLSFPEANPYVSALRTRTLAFGDTHVPPLLDRLLLSALIEARSCERFTLLSQGLVHERLRGMYRGLLASEARHHRLFRALAEQHFGEARVRARYRKLAQMEGEVVAGLSCAPRIHG